MMPGSALVHDLLTGLGILAAAGVFAWQKRVLKPDDRIWIVLAGALAGGAILGRLGTWAQHLDLRANASLAEQWLYGNRSILSGLVGAYFGALLAKRLCGYKAKTGDLFAPAVALGMAIGRVGCLLTELPGTPTGGGWGITAWDGVPRHPSFAYEIAFQLSAFVVLLRLRGKADLFTLYLVGYAIFRFGVEFVRGNEVVFAGMTRPQLFLLALAPLALGRYLRTIFPRQPSGLPTPSPDQTTPQSTAAPERSRKRQPSGLPTPSPDQTTPQSTAAPERS